MDILLAISLGTMTNGKNKRKKWHYNKRQVIELFKNFEIIDFKEVEKDCFNGLGIMKHRHIFNVIAKKI